MAWSTEISQLVTETEQFIDAVELKKPVLDAAANTAVQNAASAASAAANTAVIATSLAPSADISKGHAVATEAIANLTRMQQDAVSDSERQASLAAGYALNAGSIVQQDLSGVTATALHRSPAAVTSLFVYDTSKDSDGGAWTEKCQNTSWYNEDLSGKWLGQQPSELFARHEDGSLGPELSVNGDFSLGMENWVGASGGGATIVNNQAVVFTPAGDGYGGIRQNIALSIGKFYQISWDVIAYSGAGWRVEAANNADTGTRTGLGSFSLRFQATTASALITLAASSNAINMETATFDNFSVREVTSVTTSNDYYQLTTDGKFYRLWKNLLSRTEEFNDGVWAKNYVTVTPTSNPQEWYLANDGLGNVSSLTQNFSIFGNATFSIEMKADTVRYVRLRYLNVTNSNLINVDLETGTSDVPTLVTLLSDGFYRISLPYTFSADNNGLISIGISDVYNNPTIVPDASKRIIIRKPQLEYDSTATTYEYKGIAGPTSEVFRGNKRDFPRLAGIVTEATSVNIYDITEPGRPMWMRFTNGANTFLGFTTTTAVTNSVAALVGRITIGTSAHCHILDFSNDDTAIAHGGGSIAYEHINRRISARQANGGFRATTAGFGYIIANAAVVGVNMTVLPDAPTDPVTGLKIPTIAVATGGGISVIKQDGTVTTVPGGAIGSTKFAFDNRNIVSGRYAGSSPNFWNLGSNRIGIRNTGGNNNWGVYNTKTLTNLPATGEYGQYGIGNPVLKIFDTTKTLSAQNGLTALISSVCNTGWQIGDTRRVYISDIGVGSMTSLELVTNGTFDDNNATGWTLAANVSIVNERLTGSSVPINTFTIGTMANGISGKTYQIEFNSLSMSGTVRTYVAGTSYDVNSVTGKQVRIITATADFNTITFQPRNGAASFEIDNISVREVVADRSYKAQAAVINGAVTRTQLASGTSLVGYSGWSANNYLQEQYSADLDFGTGEFSASAWVNYVAGNPDVNLISFSDDLTNTITWVNQTGSIITVPNAASDGITSAYRYIKPNAVSFACLTLRQGVTGTLAWTIEAKIDGASPITSFHLSMSPAGGDSNYADFNLSTGTAAAFGTVTSAFIEPLSDNWYRCTGVATGAWIFNGGDLRIFPGGRSYVGDGVSGMLFARGRVRSATTAPTSHISTTGTVFNPLPGRHIFSRSHSSGPLINCGVDGYGRISAVLFDGITTRMVTTTTAYNTGQWLKAEANYTTDGSLGIRVNGREVAVTRGNPLLSLNSRYNLLSWSENTANAVWTNTSVTVSGSTLSFGISSRIYQAVSIGTPVTGATYTVSAQLSSPTKAKIALRLQGTTTTSDSAFIQVNLTATPTWYSVTRTFTSSDTSISIGLDNRITFGGDEVAGDVIVTGTQLEFGSTVKSYQRVTTVAETDVAPITIGNSYTLNAPFPGSIALLKLGATVPTAEQSAFMYEQEKQLFRADAISILPDTTAVLDMSYDDATDRWSTVSATNESYWTGLVRNSVTPVPAGAYTRIATASGVELTSRITTILGVDVTIPTYLLREDLNKRAEAASKAFKEIVNFDYVGGFTASTISGSTAITSVANLTYPVSPIGARISGTGIPANTTIVAVVGTTMYISAAATATATGVSISFLDFELPVGFEAETVATAGAIRREGATADFTRLFDGFLETIRFAVAPGATTWVQIQASRIIS